jgi:NADP-dependent 3-hydroxy acid dehydrogenase YdfG
LSRHPAKQEPLVAELATHGIISAAFRADARDHRSVASGFAAVKQRLGAIDVLEFSPADRRLPLPSATALTHENVRVWIDLYVHGAVAAVNQVLPDMLARGSGTILFTTSAASVHPAPRFGAVGAAMAWVRNWAHARPRPEACRLAMSPSEPSDWARSPTRSRRSTGSSTHTATRSRRSSC